jgi:hypothetical protein
MPKKENNEEEKHLSLEEEVEQLAACNYTPAEMAIYLNVEKKLFVKQATTPDTKIWLAIQRGKLRTDYNISLKQKELAEAGNITAVQVFEKIKEAKRVEELKNKIWFGT